MKIYTEYRYINAEVIEELVKVAKQIIKAQKAGDELGL